MNLYDRAVDLQLKLEAAQSADTSHDLLARGSNLVERLGDASTYFAAAAEFRSTAQVADRPNLDLKAISQAVGAFRGGLSRHGSAAFQHQPAATLAKVAKEQHQQAVRWVATRWRDLFSEYEPQLERIETGHLIGNETHRRVAQVRASKLRAARTIDPIAGAAELQTLLDGADIEAWLASISRLSAEMRQALEALDAERAALTPPVREALTRAAAEDGLPLAEVSDELLAALRNAGVDQHLVVRRR